LRELWRNRFRSDVHLALLVRLWLSRMKGLERFEDIRCLVESSMETAVNPSKPFFTRPTSSHSFATDLFNSWAQTGRVYGVCPKVFKSGLKFLKA